MASPEWINEALRQSPPIVSVVLLMFAMFERFRAGPSATKRIAALEAEAQKRREAEAEAQTNAKLGAAIDVAVRAALASHGISVASRLSSHESGTMHPPPQSRPEPSSQGG